MHRICMHTQSASINLILNCKMPYLYLHKVHSSNIHHSGTKHAVLALLSVDVTILTSQNEMNYLMDWRDGPIRQREAGWYSSCAIQACQPLSAPFHGCQQTPQNPTPLQGRKLSSILIPLNRTTQRDSPANFFAGEKEKRDSLWSPNNAILGIMRPACTNTMCDGVCSRDKSRANSNGKAVWIQSCVCVSVCTQMVGVYQLSSLGQTFRKYLRISKPETGFVTNILEFSWNFNYLQPDFRNLFPGQNGKIRGQTQSHTTDSRRNLSQISRTWRPSLNMKAQVLIHAREPNNELVEFC